MVNKSRGRPARLSDAKQRILTAAQVRFEADGYTKTSLRSIARQADVDTSVDLRTVFADQDDHLGRALNAVLSGSADR